MNVNYNNIYCDYIGATGTYSISDYIDITSNSLAINSSNFTLATSNILNDKITNVDIKYDKLIKEETEGITKHTYITNSNIQGQIRFITKFNTNDYRYKTRIKENGEIEVYYPEYNIIYPTMFPGWYNVMGSIRDAYNFQNIAIEITGGLTAAVNDIYQKYYGLVSATGASFSQITAQQLTQQRFSEITIGASRNTNYNRFNQVAALLGITGLGAAGIAYSVLNGIRYDNITNNILYDLSNLNLSVYSNITQTEKDTALSNLTNDTNLNIIETNNNLSNLNIINGFINSNIQTQQLIPKLKINEITFNNKTVNKFSLDALEDWIRTPNGIYYDITNGNLGISGTPNINDFLIVGGQTTIQGDLISETKMKITNTNVGLPTTGINGGAGDKLLLRNGTASIHPYSLGVNTNNMWYSAPSGASHNFYINGGTAKTSILSTGLTTTGILNASTINTTNNTNVASPQLGISGGNGDRMVFKAGAVSIYPYSIGINATQLWYSVAAGATHNFYINGGSAITTISSTGLSATGVINASTNLQEAGTNLTAKYLKLDGTNTMTGQITGVTTLSASTGLFGKVQTTNNTNVGAPSLGVSGGNGDKIVLYAGTVSDHPYSLGINANVLWYSVPSWGSHIFYNGGSAITTISSTGILSTGNIEISKGNPTLTLRGSYQDQIATLYLATPFTPSTSLKTAIISQGITSWGKSKLHFCLNNANENSTNVNYTHARMTIEPAGNVGIGTHTPNSEFLLHIYTAGANNALQAIDASGGTGQAGLRLFAGNGGTPATNRATRIDFYNNAASSSVARWSLINDYTQTGTNDFRLVNAADVSTLTILQNGNIGIGITNPFAPLNIGNPITASDGFLVISRKTTDTGSRNFRMGLNTNFNLTIGDFGNAVSGNTWRDTDFTIKWDNGYVGIGTASANNILQIGNGARLRISNGISDFTLIGTNTNDDNLNTRIVISGNSRSIYAGNIEYIATAGSHLFLTNGTNERMRIRNNGDLIKPGYIYAGGDETNGGLRIGSDGYINFYQPQKLIGSLSAHINSVLRDDNYFKFQSQSTISPFGYTPLLEMNTSGANFSVPVTAPVFICTGEIYSFTTNWNGSGQSGWFVPLNRFWTTGHAYLTCAIYLVGANGKNEYCWFGRIFLSTSNFGTPPAVNGGCILIATDLRNPSTISTNNYYIYVNELTSGGVNALFIQVNNTFYAGTIKVKIHG